MAQMPTQTTIQLQVPPQPIIAPQPQIMMMPAPPMPPMRPPPLMSMLFNSSSNLFNGMYFQWLLLHRWLAL